MSSAIDKILSNRLTVAWVGEGLCEPRLLAWHSVEAAAICATEMKRRKRKAKIEAGSDDSDGSLLDQGGAAREDDDG